MARCVLISGSSGNVGRAVISALSARGIPAKRGERAPAASADAVRLDFTDPSCFEPALRDCDAVFLMRPPALSDMRATLNPFIDCARRGGVRQFVFLSVQGADTNRIIPHHAVERKLMSVPEAERDVTILRPGFFAQNLGDAYRRDICEDDRLYVPAASGRAAFIDVRDIGDVAAGIFAAPETHRGAAYLLTGPEPVPFARAAELLSAALDRPIAYSPATVLGYVAHLRRKRRLPWAQVAVQTVLHVGLRRGQAELVDPTLERLLGRPPRTLADYIRDHVHLWTRP